jgi:curli production assembly/transport component CsgF
MTKYYLLFAFALLVSLPSTGQALVYRATNPAFGGDTFNYNWLLSSAQVQDKTKDNTAVKNTTGTPADDLSNFSNNLKSQLLSTLSRQIYQNQFGEEGIKTGTYQYGDFAVDVSPGNEGLVIRITDGKGGETSITVPYY